MGQCTHGWRVLWDESLQGTTPKKRQMQLSVESSKSSIVCSNNAVWEEGLKEEERVMAIKTKNIWDFGGMIQTKIVSTELTNYESSRTTLVKSYKSIPSHFISSNVLRTL